MFSVGSIVGAGCVVSAGTIVPPDSLVLGLPGKVVKTLDPAKQEFNRQLAQKYARLAFNHMHSGVTQQHIRWFPVAELSIPIPAAALAGFRGERRAGGGNGSVVEAGIAATSGRPEEDSIDDWMEFMGR